MQKKSISTFEKIMKNSKRKERFDKKYAEFLLSEILLDLMKKEDISIRSLAKKVGVSPAVIQDIRSGKRSNITFNNLLGIANSLGARVKIERGVESYYLTA
jgi:transcriptional regulator with XRE-family HTH domain